jgi:hypothetical protein
MEGIAKSANISGKAGLFPTRPEVAFHLTLVSARRLIRP